MGVHDLTSLRQRPYNYFRRPWYIWLNWPVILFYIIFKTLTKVWMQFTAPSLIIVIIVLARGVSNKIKTPSRKVDIRSHASMGWAQWTTGSNGIYKKNIHGNFLQETHCKKKCIEVFYLGPVKNNNNNNSLCWYDILIIIQSFLWVIWSFMMCTMIWYGSLQLLLLL